MIDRFNLITSATGAIVALVVWQPDLLAGRTLSLLSVPTCQATLWIDGAHRARSIQLY